MFDFTSYADKKFRKLDLQVQRNILKKLKQIKSSDNFSQIDSLKNYSPATHRLRVGDYRLILALKSEKSFSVLDCGHRKDIYH